MHLSKDFKPPGVSDNKRFQSTAQMAMADTASRYSGLESPGQRAKTLRERKINNTRTNVHLGFEQNQNYETAMQAGNNYDRTFKGKVAGGDGIDKLTPHEMKMKLSSSNWEFGDVKRDWSRASTLQDPTGPQFLSYRGVLNEDVRDNIKSSNLYFGPDQKLYATTARESMILKTNDIDYAGDFARAKAMKKALTSSSLWYRDDVIIIVVYIYIYISCLFVFLFFVILFSGSLQCFLFSTVKRRYLVTIFFYFFLFLFIYFC
jgi:hypothetical protein